MVETGRKSRSLLLVDDDPAVLDLLASVLRKPDRELSGAKDGYGALDALERGKYDLLVAGLGRNGMDGLELLRRARVMQPEMRVILTAEDHSPARVAEAIREHAYSYFRKPLPPGSLADMVQQALDASDWQNDLELLSARPEFLAVAVHAKLAAGERMVQFVRGATADLVAAMRDDIAAGFRELMMNSIEHGARLDGSKIVRVSLIRTRRAFTVHIADPGPGFSLDQLPHAAISNPAGSPIHHVEVRAEQGQRPGGFGILMTRNLVDELVYNERGNEVVFVKYVK